MNWGNKTWILKNYYTSSNIIYLHADISHNYREKFELFKYRDLNDYHHAHDAYLAAVLGEYKENYLKNKIDYEKLKEINRNLYNDKKFKDLRYGYFINSLDNRFNTFDEKTGELILENKKLNETIENMIYCNDILISKKTEIRTGAFYQETKNPHDKVRENDLPLKENLNMQKYGSYTEIYPSYLCLVKYGTKQKMIGIPIVIEQKSKKIPSLKYEYIRKELNLSEEDEFKILLDKIPFQQLIKYQGHLVYITGSSCELVSAIQLHIPKQLAKKWKYLLNMIFNNKKVPTDINNIPLISDENLDNQLNELLQFLIDKTKKNYPLYHNYACKFESYLKDTQLDFDKKLLFTKEFFKLLNGRNANLKTITNNVFPDRVGRLSKKTISNVTLYYTSTTGIYNRYIDKYEL